MGFVKIKFSVLLPIYIEDQQSCVKECINSLLNQTLPANEIVIVKDGKLLDDTEKLLNDFYSRNQKIIKIYSFDEHKGLGLALRDGVLLCKYPYIARMDADDVCVKDRFEKQIKYLETNDIDVLGGWIEEYNEKMTETIGIRKVPSEERDIIKKGKYRSPFNHPTVIFRKQKIIEVGNYENAFIEDYILWGKLLTNNAKVHNLDEILVKCRVNDNSYKRRSGKKYIFDVIYMEKKLLKMKYINIFQYVYNLIIRIIVSCFPINFIKIIYRKLLRKKWRYTNERIN